MSEKIQISKDDDNLELYAEWMSKARLVTRDTLMTFINAIMDGYEHSYESYVYACTACTVATTHACGEDLSGFQAGMIAKMYPLYFFYVDNRSGISLHNYDLMLYPQYEYLFQKKISPKTWAALQNLAEENYKKATEDENFNVSSKVLAHWKSIIDGKIPFGYVLWDEEE